MIASQPAQNLTHAEGVAGIWPSSEGGPIALTGEPVLWTDQGFVDLATTTDAIAWSVPRFTFHVTHLCLFSHLRLAAARPTVVETADAVLTGLSA